jgi:hypothetical protein
MTAENLARLLQQGEGISIEFKQARWGGGAMALKVYVLSLIDKVDTLRWSNQAGQN